jgi:hypothetical protein
MPLGRTRAGFQLSTMAGFGKYGALIALTWGIPVQAKINPENKDYRDYAGKPESLSITFLG